MWLRWCKVYRLLGHRTVIDRIRRRDRSAKVCDINSCNSEQIAQSWKRTVTAATWRSVETSSRLAKWPLGRRDHRWSSDAWVVPQARSSTPIADAFVHQLLPRAEVPRWGMVAPDVSDVSYYGSNEWQVLWITAYQRRRRSVVARISVLTVTSQVNGKRQILIHAESKSLKWLPKYFAQLIRSVGRPHKPNLVTIHSMDNWTLLGK